MTRQSYLPPSPPSWRRSLLVVLAGLALALGALAPHDLAGDGDKAVPVFTAREVAESAQHPGDPSHVEPFSSETHHGCVACLLQAETRGPAAAPPVSATPPLDWSVGMGLATEQAPSPGLRRAGPPRAPPARSLFS